MMYNFRYFRVFLSILFLSVLFISCESKALEEDIMNDEEDDIEEYLDDNGYDYTKVKDVYHVIIDTSENTLIEKGNTVTFWYAAYTLDEEIFETNIKSVAISADLDTTTRTFDPVVVKVGVGNLIKGLDIGLLQLRNGEEALLLFPSTLGYGDNSVGSLEPWTSLIFDIQVTDVSSK